MLNQLYTVLDHISSLFDVYKVQRFVICGKFVDTDDLRRYFT